MTRGIGSHPYNSLREADNSLHVTVADAAGVKAELNGSGAPLHLCAMSALRAALRPPEAAPAAIDPRTGRPFGDHGPAALAIEFAVDRVDGPGEGEDFLRAWREGSLDEWPEFYEFLTEQGA
jgi:hypothetical protein